ncbi:hypothetical protein BO71DRAFT_324155 [Aspergillus ellipticus CBS 707.79]|uniref:DUF3074 domain-containing protein n=1 Tax=Aspergillus ellipticus CBS 707.79 TaxID=1448320 RepID=A0A319DC61_9EURO|nr:hypothetical protein BO71DRAFT_324155 [Aspergillus ellipticus CBS 707.79]
MPPSPPTPDSDSPCPPNLQSALTLLSPTTYTSLPPPPLLPSYITTLRRNAHLIIDSIPCDPPPPTTHTNYADLPASIIHPSPAVPPPISVPAAHLPALRAQWSKPVRVTSTKDNPLQVPIYKLAGEDGKGQWFARRSVHEGLPFRTWRERLSGEMGVTLRKNQERVRRGRTPDQAVRGIGAERLVEEVLNGDNGVNGVNGVNGDGEGKVVGKVQVYHVSAQFPKPTAARDFVSLIVTWEVGDGDGDGDEGEEDEEGKRNGGREWMMVSRPCVHDDTPPVPGYIRGMYESVEYIRELPLEENDDEDGGVDGADEENGRERMNPVEWVMVTRSDPGGNIPRWMVEKGTPRSICADAMKFLNWACQEERPSPERKSTERSMGSQLGDVSSDDDESSESDFSDTEVEHHGLIASFAYLVNAGLERYAPQTVLDYLPQHSRQLSARSVPEEIQTDKSSSHDTREKGDDAASQGKASASLSVNSALDSAAEAGQEISAVEQMKKNKKGGKLSSHEKQLAKLAERKRNVEAQLDRVRTDIQALRVTPPPETSTSKRAKASTAALATTNDQPSSEQMSSSPASSVHKGSNGNWQPETPGQDPARMHKAASGLFSNETKLLKQLSKIERDQIKEASKIEARVQKQADKQEKSRSRAETDVLRHEVDVLKKEVDRLRGERKQWLDLIGSLQSENTRLAASQGENVEK